jgi:hypothetical protein
MTRICLVCRKPFDDGGNAPPDNVPVCQGCDARATLIEAAFLRAGRTLIKEFKAAVIEAKAEAVGKGKGA